jgi:hypothetical protein
MISRRLAKICAFKKGKAISRSVLQGGLFRAAAAADETEAGQRRPEYRECSRLRRLGLDC